MYTDTKWQKTQTRSKASPAKEAGRPDPEPLTAVPNSAIKSMMGVSDPGGYAIPDLEQQMQARVGRLHTDMAAEQEATEVGRQFMHSQDVVGDMSSAFGQDLSSVRIHTDTGANRRAEERGVDAFSTGRDIYFAQGAFDRSDPASRGLLAHELSHSLQQGVGGGESGMAQSAPMGVEQGGFLDWFKKKPKKSEPALEVSEPHDLRINDDSDSQKYIQRNREIANNKILDEIDAMDSDTLMDYLRSGRDSRLEGDTAFGRQIGAQNTYSTSQRDYALAKMADIASDEQLHSSELQDMILSQFTSGVNKRLTDAQARGSGDRTTTALTGFRGNDAHLYSFNRMVNRLMNDQARNNMLHAIGEADIDSVTLSSGGMGAGGTISRKNFDNAGAVLEREGAAMMSQSPEVMNLYSRAGEAFHGVKGFESPEEQSKWLMNNFACAA